MVVGTGFEPVTSSMSRKYSTTEITDLILFVLAAGLADPLEPYPAQ